MDKLNFENIKEALDSYGDYVMRETRSARIKLVNVDTGESILYEQKENEQEERF